MSVRISDRPGEGQCDSKLLLPSGFILTPMGLDPAIGTRTIRGTMAGPVLARKHKDSPLERVRS